MKVFYGSACTVATTAKHTEAQCKQNCIPQHLDSSADDILDGKDPVIQKPRLFLAYN